MWRPARSISGFIAPLLAAGLIGAALNHRATEVDRSEKSFAQMMTDSMAKMTQGAMATPMAGAPDLDFAKMMIVHHLGAIEMAQAELLHGRNPVLRRLAQEIVVTQSAEIAVLRGELDKADAFCGR